MSRGGAGGLLVLTYHAFAPRKGVTATEPAWFAETLAALTEAGFHGVDLATWLGRGRPDEPRGFALTFDDGLASILDVADTVASYRVPATVFVVTDRVGSDNDWPGQPDWVPRERLLSWSELAALDERGFRFGAHGRTHARLDGCRPAALESELRGSRDAVEHHLGRSCDLFAYPYGVSTARVRAAARRYFEAAFGTRADYARAGQDRFDLARADAYDLATRADLDAVTRGDWSAALRLIRARRAVRRGAELVARFLPAGRRAG